MILSLEERPLERREEGSQGTSKKEGNERVEWVMKERALSELVHEGGEEDLCGCVPPVAPRTPTPFRCTARGSEINGYRGLLYPSLPPLPDADTS